MSDNKQGDSKKGFSANLFLFFMGSLILLLFIQSFLDTKIGNVSFSYQLEHLVNLDLVRPEQSRKTSLKENLVTFSGQFRDEPTEEGKNRFKFLSFLSRYKELNQETAELTAEIKETKEKVREAALWYLALAGSKESFPYKVVGSRYDRPEQQNQVYISEKEFRDARSNFNLEGLSDLRDRVKSFSGGNKGQLEELQISMEQLVKNFRSPSLGIGKQPLKDLIAGQNTLLDQAKIRDNFSDRAPLYTQVLDNLTQVSNELNQSIGGVRLNALRSVRNYLESLEQYETITYEYDDLLAKYEKAKDDLVGAIWYFNGKELTTKALESQDFEKFYQWFVSAKAEWIAFDENKGSFFKAPDQPLNIVLEKKFKSEEPPPNYLSYFFSLLPVLLVVLLLYFVFARQMKGMGNGAMNFGKAPARMLDKEKHKVTFKDVAGVEESLEELEEIVEFLKNPKKFTSLGGRIPKGVLCIGPPGTGKTLIAKAVAGEADRPFFSISGSDFVEMFVGVGASRIRDLFEQAKKQAPCIIFIDEIDAVGRHRGAGIGGGHDEREQTLNQLLVEMDGFDSKEGIILVAATNRPDVLDRALLRPGRFDRRVVVDLPDVKGRFDILKVHARHIKLDKSVDLMAIARSTPGSSGADLENLLNEAALLAARRNRKAVMHIDVTDARDKVLFGKERRSLEMDESEKLTTSYHESGHAVIGMVVEHADPVEKVTIIPRGMSLGATHFLPKKNRVSYWKKELIDRLAVLMGGRVAEEIFIGDICSGAQQDIVQATELARSMVCQWGMSKKLGKVAYTEKSDHNQYLGGSTQSRAYSENTAELIDEEVKGIIDAAYQRAQMIVEEHREQVQLMTDMLMEFETLDREDIEKIMEGTWSSDDKRKKLKELSKETKAGKKEKAADEKKGEKATPPPLTFEEKKAAE